MITGIIYMNQQIDAIMSAEAFPMLIREEVAYYLDRLLFNEQMAKLRQRGQRGPMGPQGQRGPIIS